MIYAPAHQQRLLRPLFEAKSTDEWLQTLSAAEVKIAGAPVWVHALDEPGVYLPL